tara:strand:- start:171 stop:506 length:336 start_codon:yes stop_codon:yes gene_type:complete
MIKYEKETIISFNEEEDMATIYSCSSSIWNKCKKLGLKQIDSFKDSDGNIISKTFEIEKRLVSFRKPRVLTDEQKRNLRERAKMMRTNSEDLENFPKDNIVEDLKKEVSIN